MITTRLVVTAETPAWICGSINGGAAVVVVPVSGDNDTLSVGKSVVVVTGLAATVVLVVGASV